MATKRKIPQTLNPQQTLFAKNLIKTKGNQKKAYLKAYPDADPKHAPAYASRLVSNHPEIIEYARQTLTSQGVTIEALSRNLKKHLNSKKTIIVNNDTKLVSDNTTQLKATELGFKLHGLGERQPINADTVNITNNQVFIADKLSNRLDKVLGLFGIKKEESQVDDELTNDENVVDVEPIVDTVEPDAPDSASD